LQNGSVPDGDKEGDDPKYKMPSFGNTYAMSQPQIANVEAYVLALNDTPRATIAKTRVPPKTYAWLTLGGFLIVGIVGGLALSSGRE
jgi:hypothetical protein